ncbi:MAG: serine/threonine protein phosphatase, partial [Desulfobulbaceae bacterium]|nr:serine/threonine protein phosphatase [Desulfobulbaceae bacterium]
MSNKTLKGRRDFLKAATSGAIAGMLPVSLVRLAGATEHEPDFTFAYISDSHIQNIKGAEFVRNWDRGLIRAVAEANLLEPKPDFVVFGGDLAQLGTRAELDHGAEILAGLNQKPHVVLGEHDYYLDLGECWSEL